MRHMLNEIFHDDTASKMAVLAGKNPFAKMYDLFCKITIGNRENKEVIYVRE